MRNAMQDNVVAFTGRHDSGKTTVLERVVAALCAHGLTVSSLKHHGHPGFEFDVPGKDSWRHHAAGTLATAVLSPDRFGLVEETACDDCRAAVGMLPASNLVLVEGYRHAGFPTVEVLRAASERDRTFAPSLEERLRTPLDQMDALGDSLQEPLPVAVVTDLPSLRDAAEAAGVPAFGFEEAETARLAEWLAKRFAKPLMSVAVQAGGESKRMGTSKALVPFHGVPLAQHVAGRMAPVAADLLITTNEPERLAFMRGLFPGVRLVRDVLPERGSLPGLITALEEARFPIVGLVACDMVDAPAGLIRHEAELLAKDPSLDAVVPVTGFGFEPLCAVYRRDVCLRAARDAYAAGHRRLRDVLERLRVHRIDAKVDPHVPRGCFRNVNTPNELEAAEGLRRSHGHA